MSSKIAKQLSKLYNVSIWFDVQGYYHNLCNPTNVFRVIKDIGLKKKKQIRTMKCQNLDKSYK